MVRDGIQALLELTTNSPREHNLEDLTADMAKMTVGSVVASMQPIMKSELKMCAEAIALRYSDKAGCYFVELGQLCDYMKANRIRDFKEAISNVCEVNEGSGATADNTAILIDEKACNSIINDCKECAKTNNNKLKECKLQQAQALESALEIIANSGVMCVLNPEN